MVQVTVDGPALAELSKAKGKTEVFDERGNLVGHFYPSSEYRLDVTTGEFVRLSDVTKPNEDRDIGNRE